LIDAAAAIDAAARSLIHASLTASAQRPRKATAVREADGSLTVTYETDDDMSL
jgi:hypothetical protein